MWCKYCAVSTRYTTGKRFTSTALRIVKMNVGPFVFYILLPYYSSTSFPTMSNY